MKKKIVLFAYEEEALKNYAQQIEWFFGDIVEVQPCRVAEDTVEGNDISGADLYVASLADVVPVGAKILGEQPLVHISRTFYKDKTEFLKELPNGSTVLYFDYSDILALETLAVLQSINREVKFIYCASEEEMIKYPQAQAIVVVASNYPKVHGTDKIISVGWYAISTETYFEIAKHLDVMDDAVHERLYKYGQQVHVANQGIMGTINEKREVEDIWDEVIDMISEGVVLLDERGRVLRYNKYAQAQGIIIPEGETATVQPYIRTLTYERHRFANEVCEIKERGKTVLLSAREIVNVSGQINRLLTARDAREVSFAEISLRTQQRKKRFFAKYSFDDILTLNTEMERLIQTGRQIAKTDVSVLLTGDTGVGKEMFAQSIHNASVRADMPFVAMNCAAIPAHLLESELFGYEEGAFTGAKRGGKKGLLELAHGGTIFFDEMGEMPLTVQAKLLRVLQEREILHVGGDTLIPINVRVVAASNVNFEHLIEEKQFRKDLFYRIGAVQMEILPLARRREDIPLLAKHFLGEMSRQTMKRELLEYMQTLPWEGNVRELRNCIEYMVALGEDVLTVEDLPINYRKEIPVPMKLEKSRVFDCFIGGEREIAEEILKILEIRPLGRRTLTEVLNQRGFKVSEYKLRKILEILREQDLIQINSGRHGIELK